MNLVAVRALKIDFTMAPWSTIASLRGISQWSGCRVLSVVFTPEDYSTSNKSEKLLRLVLKLPGFNFHFPLVGLLTNRHRDIPPGSRE